MTSSRGRTSTTSQSDHAYFLESPLVVDFRGAEWESGDAAIYAYLPGVSSRSPSTTPMTNALRLPKTSSGRALKAQSPELDPFKMMGTPQRSRASGNKPSSGKIRREADEDSSGLRTPVTEPIKHRQLSTVNPSETDVSDPFQLMGTPRKIKKERGSSKVPVPLLTPPVTPTRRASRTASVGTSQPLERDLKPDFSRVAGPSTRTLGRTPTQRPKTRMMEIQMPPTPESMPRMPTHRQATAASEASDASWDAPPSPTSYKSTSYKFTSSKPISGPLRALAKHPRKSEDGRLGPSTKMHSESRPPSSASSTNAIAARSRNTADSTESTVLPATCTPHLSLAVKEEQPRIVPGLKKDVVLLEHQVVAREIMRILEQLINGGLLADAMGLGKTLQVVVRYLDGRSEGDVGPTLIVCPVALLTHWHDEFKAKADGVRVLIYHDAKVRRLNAPHKLRQYDVVVTTYGIVVSEAQGGLSDVFWKRIVLDEAAVIRNHETQTAMACCALRGKFRWCLSGTPIHNKSEDLYSLFKFLKVPQYGEDYAYFEQHISRPLKRDPSCKSAVVKLHSICSKLMLRRPKFIIDLPERHPTETIRVRLGPIERAVYDSVDGYIDAVYKGRKKGAALVAVLRKRQACDHPSLLRRLKPFVDSHDEYSPIPDEDVLSADENEDEKEDTGSSYLRGLISNGDYSPDSNDNGWSTIVRQAARFEGQRSAKMEEIFRLLKETELRSLCTGSAEKTIIFSQWTSMLDLMEPFLDAEGIGYARYDGSMSMGARKNVLKSMEIDSKKTVFLVSLKAGGSGLNLTMCNNVILVDPWWNPAEEEQAFDRVHRIGQKKPVYAYRLVAEDTVEERVLKLQEVKRSLATAVLDNGPDLTAVEKLECCFGDVKRATAFPGALRYRQ